MKIKVCQSRKSMHTVMAHGNQRTQLKVIRTMFGVAYEYIVPEEHINMHNRKIKIRGKKLMENFFTNIAEEVLGGEAIQYV